MRINMRIRESERECFVLYIFDGDCVTGTEWVDESMT